MKTKPHKAHTVSQIEFFFEGDDYFTKLWEDLKSAQSSIYIESYTLEKDHVGKQLQSILIEKAKQGIKVYLLVDGIGSWALPESYRKELQKADVQVKVFHPVRLFKLGKHLNQRDHRKMVSIDNKIAYIGGMNLFEKLSQEKMGPQAWRDTHMRIKDPKVIFKLNYYFRLNFRLIKKKSRKIEKASGPIHIVASGKNFGRNPIRHLIQRYIKRSQDWVHITTAYFIPDIETILRLRRAAKKGVDVKIITSSPQHSDVPQVNRIQRPILKYLIKRGVQVFYYQERMIHAKTIVFGPRLATIGSSNMNYRSFFRDLELNAFLHHKHHARTLEQQFQKDLALSRPVTLEELSQRSLWDRFVDMMFYSIRSFF